MNILNLAPLQFLSYHQGSVIQVGAELVVMSEINYTPAAILTLCKLCKFFNLSLLLESSNDTLCGYWKGYIVHHGGHVRCSGNVHRNQSL